MTILASRSKLFTPATTPERFEAAARSGADLVVLDLEDSVPDRAKTSARAAVSRALDDGLFADQRVGVRINDPASNTWHDDLTAVVGDHLDEVHVPKVQHPDQVTTIAAAIRELTGATRAASAPGHRPRPLGIVATIETATGLVHLAEIASCSPLLVGLQLGVADLALDVGIEPDDTRLGWFRATLAVAAAAAGIPAYDTVHLDHRNLDAFRASALEARRWGMRGKSCIHPDQVPIANAVFSPTEQERAWARRVVAAWDDAVARGEAAVSLDGQLVDRPVARAARRLLDDK